MVAARKTLSPILEDIDRSQRIAAKRAIKDRASLLAEIDLKNRDDARVRETENVVKMHGNEKRMKDVKIILEENQVARETVERLERERRARLQQIHSRRNAGRMPFVKENYSLQHKDKAATELLVQAPFVQRQRTQSNIYVIKIARSIAQVSSRA